MQPFETAADEEDPGDVFDQAFFSFNNRRSIVLKTQDPYSESPYEKDIKRERVRIILIILNLIGIQTCQNHKKLLITLSALIRSLVPNL